VGFGAVHDVGVVHHLGQLVVVEGLAQLTGNSLEAVEVSESASRLVPDVEDLGDSLARLGVADLGADDFEELVELDGSVHFPQSVDHFENNLASAFQAEFVENLFDFNWVDGSSSVFVEEVEGGFELLVVGFIETILPVCLCCDFSWWCTFTASSIWSGCSFAVLHKIFRYYKTIKFKHLRNISVKMKE